MIGKGAILHAKNDSSQAPPPEVPIHILDQAIAWAVQLHSGLAKQTDKEACAAWRALEPLHEKAWQCIQTVDQQLEAIPGDARQVACLTLDNAFRNRGTSRRQVLKHVTLAAVAVGTGLLIGQTPWQQRKTFATDMGIRRSIHLHDGSRLLLNSNTRIDVIFSPLRRTIRLERGEVFIETGTDSKFIFGRRGFWLETGHARLEAIGTQFNVCEEINQTRLHVVEGAVAVQLAAGRLIFRPDDTVLIDTARNSLSRVDRQDHDPTAWTQGIIVARRMSLTDFAAQLNRYHEVKVRIAGDASDLCVSGVFQLDGPAALKRTLNALASILAVEVNREGDSFVVKRCSDSNPSGH